MVVLALDTATKRGSIAISIDDEIHAREGDDTRTHGERLPGEILDWLQQHGRTLDDVDLFAVVAGPGSFTGLRVGMAAIQGIALVRQRRVIAIPTLESMASAWLDTQRDRGPLLVPCLDGQRGDVFLAAYDSIGAATVEDCRVELAPTVTRPEQAAADVAAVADARQVIVIGNGGQRYASAFRRELPNATMVDVPVPLAAAAVRLATRRASAAVSPHALRPVYLRRPDAVLARERARRYAPVTDEASASGARFWITRGIGPDDLIAVESLQRRAFTNPWGAEAIRWELEHTDVARLYVMRDDEGLLVAYCACWMVFDELHINSLAVEETLRRRGIARTLLKHVLADASAAGASSATLEVRQSNVAARQLYEGLGFKIEGIRRDYYQDPREDALILWHRDLTVFRRP